MRDKFFTLSNLNKVHLGGVSYKDLVNDYKINRKDLDLYLPPEAKKLEKSKIEVHYLGYYLKWTPQEVYYYAVENCDFRPRPFKVRYIWKIS